MVATLVFAVSVFAVHKGRMSDSLKVASVPALAFAALALHHLITHC